MQSAQNRNPEHMMTVSHRIVIVYPSHIQTGGPKRRHNDFSVPAGTQHMDGVTWFHGYPPEYL